MVDLGVRGGRVRAVLAQEAVDESACRAPGEGACQLRTYEKGVGQCLLVHGVRARLGGGEERRAELGRVRAGREHRGDLAAAHDAAGRDDRDLHGLADLRDQREQSDAGAVRLRVVPVGALVAARLDALHDDRGGSGPLHGERFLGRGRGDQGEGAGAGEGVQDVAGGDAEVEGDHRHRVVVEDREFGVVAVVAAAVRVAEFGLVPGGLTRELVGVHLDGGLVRVFGLRHEEVHAEGSSGNPAQLLDLLVHTVGGLVPGGEEAEPAGLGHGGREMRDGYAARHGGLHDRVWEEIGQCGGHDGMLSRPPNKSESSLRPGIGHPHVPPRPVRSGAERPTSTSAEGALSDR